MRHPVLFGEFELTIDERSRLFLPADVKRAIPPEYGDSLFLVMGVNRVPWLYPERYYEDLVMQAPAEMTPDEDMLAFDQLNFAMASKLPVDKQGRILIPEKTLKRMSVGKEVTLIGARDHLEVWNRADWEVRREDLTRRGADIAARAKRARQTPPGS